MSFEQVGCRIVIVTLSLLIELAGPAAGQTASQPASPVKAASIHKRPGVWVEGPGYEITYGANYDTCAKRCLASAKCVMLEYYRPEKKCNHYDQLRPRKTGGASDVGIRR
jgi:hypothetical protein